MIVINDDKDTPRYKIEPVDELNYRLHKWVPEHTAERTNAHRKEGEVIEARWEAQECYASSLHYALRMVYERMLKEDLVTPERGLKAAIQHAKTLSDKIYEISERVTLDD